MRIAVILFPVFSFFGISCNQAQQPLDPNKVDGQVENLSPFFVNSQGDTIYRVIKTEEEWKAELGQMEYYILRHAGTERPFTGDLLGNKKIGIYTCAGCGLALFESDTKFESGCGWPSYFQAIDPAHIIELQDSSYGMVRTELRCARCGGHLGHVFNDGPPPTGLRYCINSVSLNFEEGE